MKFIEEIRQSYRKDKIVTGFMGAVVVLAVLTYIKPVSTSGILSYIGFTAVNFIFLAFILAVLWWFYRRKG